MLEKVCKKLEEDLSRETKKRKDVDKRMNHEVEEQKS